MNIYGVLIGIGIVLGIELIKRNTKDFTYKHILILLLSSLVGARALFLLHNIKEISNGEILPYAVWDGGLAFFGALIGILSSVYILSVIKKKNFFNLSDHILLFLPLIHSIGRLGNFFNYELYGKPTNLPWGIYIPQQYRAEEYIQYNQFHPVFLYESILNILNFSFLLFLSKKSKKKGVITGTYLVLYSLIRLLMNTLRIDKEYLFIFETSDLLSSIFLISGILILIMNMSRNIKEKLAKFFSRVLTLFLVFLSLLSITLNMNIEVKYEILLILFSVVIPLSTILLFRVFGITSDLNVTKREERPKLFLIFAISFLSALLISIKTGDIRLITIYTVLNITFVIGFLITLYWKISFHMIWSIISIFVTVYLWNISVLYLLFLAIPLIGWSRIQLKRHTLSQVIAGILLTTLCIFLVLTFLKF